MHHLIMNPSDIYYLTGVRPHDPGEILILLNALDSTLPTGQAGSRSQAHLARSPKYAELLSEIFEGGTGMTEKVGIIFCDARTSALFDSQKYQIIDDRKKWEEAFKKYSELHTDPDFLTQTLREKIEKYGVQLQMQKSPITESRSIKTPEKIQKLRTSQAMNKKVYEQILPFFIPGVTEEAIARRIQILQLELGASGPSFPPIVAFGENTAVPHHSPTTRVLHDGDVVLVDMGLIYDGYCSDMTRMLVVQNTKGKGQNDRMDEFKNIYSLLQKVTREIISWAKPGMKVAELDQRAREMLGEYEPYFTHSLGHGVGIDIHEAPWISVRSDEVLQSGMIITIEPGVYFPQGFLQMNNEEGIMNNEGSFNNPIFGARYEEMVVVDKNGLILI